MASAPDIMVTEEQFIEALTWSKELDKPERVQLFYWLRQELPAAIGVAFVSSFDNGNGPLEPNEYHFALATLLDLDFLFSGKQVESERALELFAVHLLKLIELAKKFKKNDYSLSSSSNGRQA